MVGYIDVDNDGGISLAKFIDFRSPTFHLELYNTLNFFDTDRMIELFDPFLSELFNLLEKLSYFTPNSISPWIILV